MNKIGLTITLAILVVSVGVGILLANNRSPEVSKVKPDATYSAGDIAMHDSRSDCWTIISDTVYDITDYVSRHPGGNEILRACGRDATTLFKTRTDENGRTVGTGAPHSQTAEQMLSNYKVGTLR